MSKIRSSYTELACIDEGFKNFGHTKELVATNNTKQLDLYNFWLAHNHNRRQIPELTSYFGKIDEISSYP